MPTASYPNFAGKHAGQALFTAADFLAYLRQVGGIDDQVQTVECQASLTEVEECGLFTRRLTLGTGKAHDRSVACARTNDSRVSGAQV